MVFVKYNIAQTNSKIETSKNRMCAEAVNKTKIAPTVLSLHEK